MLPQVVLRFIDKTFFHFLYIKRIMGADLCIATVLNYSKCGSNERIGIYLSFVEQKKLVKQD